MDVLILLAKDPNAMTAKLAELKGLGIPVIGYDRLVDNPDVFYLTFDNQGVGRIMAEVITGLVPAGNYAIIKGHAEDPNADFLRAGMEEILKDKPDIKIPAGCEDYSDNWNTENAKNNMVECLAATNNDIQAVLSENDSMAGGVVSALSDVGLKIPVSGQDGDIPALNRVALGTQTVSVWKDSLELGRVAGALALQLSEGKALNELVAPDTIKPYAKPDNLNAVEFQVTDASGNPTNKVWSITLKPNPVQIANLNEPIDSGWADGVMGPGKGKAAVCAGADPATVPACA
jgi:D-xylose transport system substrate-binding protein